MKFNELLRDLRKRAGLTQEELASKACVPVTSLRGHEQGQRVPSWASVVKLAKALGVSTDVFAGCDEVREDEPVRQPGRSAPSAKRGGEGSRKGRKRKGG